MRKGRSPGSRNGRHNSDRLGGLRGKALSTVFGLIAATGMRLRDALGLDDRVVDLQEAVLTIRRGKGGQFRLLPISTLSAGQLDADRQVRKKPFGSGGTAFFLNDAGRRPTKAAMQAAFARVGTMVDFREFRLGGDRGREPRTHDLRHATVVQTIIYGYRQGVDPDREMIKLTIDLGHAEPAQTHRYVEAVPELMRLACERAEKALGEGGTT